MKVCRIRSVVWKTAKAGAWTFTRSAFVSITVVSYVFRTSPKYRSGPTEVKSVLLNSSTLRVLGETPASILYTPTLRMPRLTGGTMPDLSVVQLANVVVVKGSRLQLLIWVKPSDAMNVLVNPILSTSR